MTSEGRGSSYPRPKSTEPCPESWDAEVWDQHLEDRRWHNPYCSAAGQPCPLDCQAWATTPARGPSDA